MPITKTTRLSLFPKPTFSPPPPKTRTPLPSTTPAKSTMPSPAHSLGPPPPTPSPWVWQCHHCRAVYRIATTRRCLECSHTMCSSLTFPPTYSPSSTRKRKRTKPGGPCKAEFDYAGWRAWGAWRRGEDELGYRDSEMANTRREERMILGVGTKNCYRDCDHPSECLHVRHKAKKTQTRRGLLARLGVVQEEKAESMTELELLMQLADRREGDLGGRREEKVAEPEPEDFAVTASELDFTSDEDTEVVDNSDLDFYDSSSDSDTSLSDPELEFSDFDIQDHEPVNPDTSLDVTLGVESTNLDEAREKSRKKISQLTGLSYLSLPQPCETPAAVSALSLDTNATKTAETNESAPAAVVELRPRTRYQVRRLREADERAAAAAAAEQLARELNERNECEEATARAQEEWETWLESDDESEGPMSPEEKDLAELMKVRNAFMRGEV